MSNEVEDATHFTAVDQTGDPAFFARFLDEANKITYHPQSGWFEDTPLKGGTEEGCPLKGVYEGTFLIEAGHPAWNYSRASGLIVVLRLGLLYGLGSGLPHKTSSASPQRRNGRACSSLTARGGGLPVGVTSNPTKPPHPRP